MMKKSLPLGKPFCKKNQLEAATGIKSGSLLIEANLSAKRISLRRKQLARERGIAVGQTFLQKESA